jgi:hypothetical protein
LGISPNKEKAGPKYAPLSKIPSGNPSDENFDFLIQILTIFSFKKRENLQQNFPFSFYSPPHWCKIAQ